MPILTAYPTESALFVFLSDAGITPPDAQLEKAMNGAVAEWEGLTGFKPFLWTSADSTTYDFYHPPQSGYQALKGYVELSAVYYNVVASVSNSSNSTANITARSQTIAITTPGGTTSWTGTAARANVDYVTCPLGDETGGSEPIRGIEWLIYPGDRPRSILIQGKRGYCSTLSQEHYNAILHGAAAYCYAIAQEKRQGGLKSVNIGGDVDVEWAEIKGTVAQGWRESFVNTALSLKRRSV